jgi:outer membrane murein-binding lipoprotein Lpp
MRRPVVVMRAAVIAALLVAGPATAAQTGGLATNVGRGGLALSAGIGYVERDVKDGIDAESASRRLAFRAQFG